MRFDREFLSSTGGQVALLCAVAGLVLVAARWRKSGIAPLPVAKAAPAASLPKTFVREGARLPKVTPLTPQAYVAPQKVDAPKPVEKSRLAPLAIWTAEAKPPASRKVTAPFGRLIPCATTFALESNRIDSPVVAVVTEDVWHDGHLIVPAGAEVHGKATLDRTRERIAAQGAWHIVWRTPGANDGLELVVNGVALDRNSGADDERNGSAGLRGAVVKTRDDRDLKLFASTFLATATAALQDTHPVSGLLGEAALPLTTVRNATLAGTGAVLREYAQSMRDAIVRDGFYVRVPAGKPFYLYVTETINRSEAAAPQP